MSHLDFDQAVHRNVSLLRLTALSRLFQTDLVSTVGESVALGAAGIIMWGDAMYASSKVSVHMLLMKQNALISPASSTNATTASW